MKEREAMESYRHLKKTIADKIQWEKELLRRTHKQTGKRKNKKRGRTQRIQIGKTGFGLGNGLASGVLLLKQMV